MSLLAAILVLAAPPAPAEVKPTKVVKFDDLVRAVKAHKGRVVVVDFWTTAERSASWSSRIWSRCTGT